MSTARPQISVFDELIVDNFAGGGGASTGIELAAGRVVDIAINHDPDAILMHQTNHPYTRHYQASVWDIDPVEVCAGQPVGLAWFSPDCKHFSKAKGGKPVDKRIRGLAWIALRWAGTVRPRVIILENVEEFQDWGPCRRGKPIKSRKGETFSKFVAQLRDIGYMVEWRELVAADYGAPTIRKRFFLIARRDGRPIVWSERTHAPMDSEEVRSGKCKPWRSAAEIIDWSLPMYSVFDSKQEIKEQYGTKAVRPLAENTMRRIIRGVDKFTIRSGKPFLVPIGYGERKGQLPRVHDIAAPLSTVVSTTKHNLCAAHLAQYHTEQSEMVRGQGLASPIQTVDTSNRYGLVSANLVEYFGSGRPLDLRDGMHTVTTHDREALAAAHVVEFKGQDIGQTVHAPLRTITTSAGEFALCKTVIAKVEHGADLGYWSKIRELFNRHCGYDMSDDEVMLLEIDGTVYYIRDILMRMLAPRELYNAMGFPADYIIDHDYTGKEYKKDKQVARCGNAVPPPFATALVRANLPEWCDQKITTMAEFGAAVAV